MKTLIKKNFRYLFLLTLIFIFYRLPLLGFDIINTDAPRWKRRSYVFSSAIFSGDFEKTAVIYHPGVIVMWLCTFSIKVYNLLSRIILGTVDISTPLGFSWLHFTEKLSVVLFISISFFISLYILHKIFKQKFVLLFFTLFTFEPMVLAYTRVLHTDALVTFMSFTSVLAIYYGFFKKVTTINIFHKNINSKYFWYSIASIYTGMALLTKSNSLFLLPFIGLELVVLNLYKYKRGFVNIKLLINFLKDYFVWLILVVLVFFTLWPAMWVGPISTLQYYFSGIVGIGVEGGHTHKWFGVITEDPGYLFYSVILLIRYTPWFLLFSFAGIATYFYGYLKKKPNSSLLLISFLFIIFYYFFMSIPTKKLDRYLLPSIPFLSVFASFYLTQITEIFKNKLNQIRFLFISIFILFMLNLFSTYKFFPNYLAYYSPLVGGFKGGTEIVNHKWPLGHRELYTYINSLSNAKNRKTFIRKPFLYDPYLIGDAYDVVDVEISKPGDLYILKGTSDFKFLKNRKYKQLTILKMGDIPYFWVYEFIE